MNEIDEYFGDDFFEENEVEQPSGEGELLFSCASFIAINF